MSLADPIMMVLPAFEPAFSRLTWSKVHVLIIGTLWARGRRTVAAALRQTGLPEGSHFSLDHHVLSRARWSALDLSRRLLQLLVRTFVAAGGDLTCGIDETLERRWGRHITLRGHDRDPLASGKPRSVAASGLRWIVLTLVITPPWTQRPWALPVLSVPAPTPEVSQRLGRRHKTVPQRARQMLLLVRRWLPTVELTIMGDQTSSVLALGRACTRHRVRVLAPLRLDAALYAPAPPRLAGTNGRPRVQGERWPQLTQVLKEAQTLWPCVRVRWYDGRRRALEVTSGTAVWYRIGQPVLPVRWVIVRDPQGRLEPRAYFSTCPTDCPRDLVRRFVPRWTIETTFEESRAHLGVETQRQWSDRALARTTPCVFGLYSLVALLAHALPPDGKIPVQRTAWYDQSHATFAAVLAAVRRHLWGDFSYSTSARDPDGIEIPKSELYRLANAVCYSH
jgi:DDE superfamily endonuclease